MRSRVEPPAKAGSLPLPRTGIPSGAMRAQHDGCPAQSTNVLRRDGVCLLLQAQPTHRKRACVGRLALSIRPHTGHVRLVLRGLTATTFTPASAALYSTKERSWAKAQPCNTRRCAWGARIRSRRAFKSSSARARWVEAAFCTSCLERDMVDVGLEALLLPTPLLQQSLGGTGAFRLKTLPQAVVPTTNTSADGAGVQASVTIRRQVDDAQIEAQDILRDTGLRAWAPRRWRTGRTPRLGLIDEIGLALEPIHQRPLVLAHQEGHDDPSAERRQRDAIQAHYPTVALVIDNGAVGLERRSDLLVALVRVADFGQHADSHLRPKPEVCPQLERSSAAARGTCWRFDLRMPCRPASHRPH